MLDGLETPVSGSDTVVILPAMAGGLASAASARDSPADPHRLGQDRRDDRRRVRGRRAPGSVGGCDGGAAAGRR